MASEIGSDDEVRGRSTEQAAPDVGPASTLCWACQQPIENESTYLWRGEPVHQDCEAELQCGVRLKQPPDE